MSSSWHALADPNRRAVLELLLERPRPVGELVEQLGLSQPGTSKHLKVLREAGLVQVRQDANRRVYALDPGPIRRARRLARALPAAVEREPRRARPAPRPRRTDRVRDLRDHTRASPPCASSASTPTPSSASGARSRCPRRWPDGSPARSRSTCARAARCASPSTRTSPSRWTAGSSSSTRRKVFAFLWGKDLLRLELAPEGDGTRLTLIQTLEADEAARNAAGWHVCLDKLAGEDTDWEPLYEEYQRRGVPAGAEIPGR